eukprot:CAMPEP_0201480672 /NCGR_PEP_ID=MMETSP0151_2-20130828/5114_1 /ASSEMBLY_ACC=CAM_ASM_000257 /TAXON_ID=200890 /ORGANISM="Paramoeba atlantica, Strain 621/1 / CCAP 1560/9" /LENGTH=346 /DNA_ID=CAMNT_0047862609 /DNA_START=64 /DNA_END=1101 /DNA_ORIENTATION=-
MCRILVYFSDEMCPILLADLIIRPAHSIIKQSYDARERLEGPKPSLNGDGFGIGWFPTVDFQEMIANVEKNRNERRMMGSASTTTVSLPTQDAQEKIPNSNPCIFTGITPAWNNINLRRLSENVSSHLIFAHVRAASPGFPTNEANCHPFQWRHYMFMHNGCVGGFHGIRRRVITRLDDKLFHGLQGNTDSEHCFLLFLQILHEKFGCQKCWNPSKEDTKHLDPSFSEESDSFCFPQKRFEPEELRDAMNETIRTLGSWLQDAAITQKSLLNFALTDGNSVLVTRYANAQVEGCSMYYASGSSFDRIKGETYGMVQSGRREVCHIISSEPLAQNVDSVDWVPVPNN